VALAAIWTLTWVNVRGVRSAGLVQLVTTALKLLPLVAIATLGLAFLDLQHFRPFNLSGRPAFPAVTATAALTLWALLGLESATIPAAHVENPTRTIPRATILGTTLVAALYIMGTVAVMGVVAPSALAGSTAPFADAARQIWGPWAEYAVGVGAAVACFGTLNGWILLQGQIPHAAACDGLFPRPLARLSRRGTPDRALLISSALATLLMAANFTRGLVQLFTFMLLLSTMTSLVAYLLSAMAALIIPAPAGEGRGALGPRAAVIAALAFLFSLWAIAGSGKDAVFWGFLLLCAGVPVYVWIRRKSVASNVSAPVASSQ
jgi:APA family basic amino acid/polyamine antiporter